MASDLAFHNDNMTPEQKERSALRRKAQREYADSKTISEDLRRAVREKRVGQAEAEGWLKDATIPGLVKTFKGLTADNAAEVWKVATPDEKKLLFPAYSKKLQNQAGKVAAGRAVSVPQFVQ